DRARDTAHLPDEGEPSKLGGDGFGVAKSSNRFALGLGLIGCGIDSNCFEKVGFCLLANPARQRPIEPERVLQIVQIRENHAGFPCWPVPARRPPMALTNLCQISLWLVSARSPRFVNAYTRRRRPEGAVVQRLERSPACSKRWSAGMIVSSGRLKASPFLCLMCSMMA